MFDGDLGGFGKSLQQPRQCHFHQDMVIRHIEMTRCRLPQRADTEAHAIFVPSLLVDLQHRNTGSGAGQPRLEAPGCFLAAKTVGYRNDEGSGHLSDPVFCRNPM